MADAMGQTGSTALARVLFVRATTAATLHPWFDDFVDEAAAICDVRLFDAASRCPNSSRPSARSSIWAGRRP